MLVAAAGLILNDNRVLAFKKYDKEGVSIPCGKVEDGEEIITTAYREIKEETGLEVDLDASNPFIGFDIIDNNLVYTFIGKVRRGILLDEKTATKEGIPIWTSKRDIIYGPYGHYNNRLLAHFNLEVPLAGKFHSHITIEMPTSNKEAERAAKLINGKLTLIDLSRNDKTQSDFMITHHYLTGQRGLEDEHDIVALLTSRAKQLQQSGFKVTRIKLEHEPLHEKSPIDDILNSLNRIYTEIHIKCVLEEAKAARLIATAKELNWHPSKNPFAIRNDGKIVRFVNKRLYGVISLYKIDKEIDKIIPHIATLVDIEEIKYETAIYDSNEDLDKWWMK